MTAGPMRRIRYLVMRDGNYWFQRRVPLDLPQLGKVWFYSLKAKTKQQAIRACERETVRTSTLIDEARNACSIVLFDRPTGVVRIVEEKRSDKLDLESTLRQINYLIQANPGADLRDDVAAMIQASLAKALPPEVAPPVKSMTVAEMLDAFHAACSPHWESVKTTVKYEFVSELLRELYGSRRADGIRRSDMDELAALLVRVPSNMRRQKIYAGLTFAQAADKADKLDNVARLNETTVNGYILKVGAIFSWAVERSIISANPASKLKVGGRGRRRVKQEQRKPFGAEALKTLVASLPDDPDRRWPVLIALYNGLRLNEACQLEASDILRRDNTWCIRVTGDSDDEEDTVKRTKNDASERLIPVHPRLIELGLLDLRKEGRLFPSLPISKEGYYSDLFSRWFSKHLRQHGIKAPKTSFHSLRHTYRDALRDTDIPGPMQKALGGWADSSVSSRYGQGFRVSKMAEELAKLQYDL